MTNIKAGRKAPHLASLGSWHRIEIFGRYYVTTSCDKTTFFPSLCYTGGGGEMAGDDLDAIVTSIKAKRGREGRKGDFSDPSLRLEGEPDQISI